MDMFIANEQYLFDDLTHNTQRATRIAGNLIIVFAIVLGIFFVFFFRRNLFVVSQAYERALLASEEHLHSLAESEERYRSLVDMAPNGIVIYKDNRIIFANTEALQIINGHDVNNILGKPPEQLFLQDGYSTIKERIQTILEFNRPVTGM